MKCANCNKGVMYGHNVSHSKRRTKRLFKPNLHVSKIMINGRSMRIKLCVKCLRMFKGAATSNVADAKVEKVEVSAPSVATA